MPSRLLAIAAGGLLLVWPALWNGFPIVFSDTGAFLHQTLGPLMIWDKPWIYGPLLHLFHERITLWLPLAAQGLLVSWLLWLTLRSLGRATPARHVLVCAALAALTTAPFSTALLMPDILVVAVVLPAFLLGWGFWALTTAERIGVVLAATVATASHLSFLPLAAGLAVIALAGGIPAGLRAALPLVLAIGLLATTNRIGHGTWSVSPHGSTFLLARLIADGPAARTISDRCAANDPGWYLCAWAGRLPVDSDVFLWAPDSPVNRDATGQPRFLGGALLSPEARTIVAETIWREPWAVTRAILVNTAEQLVTLRPGDTLVADHLALALRPQLEGFSARETARFDASLQAQGRLAAPELPYPALVLLALPLLLWGAWRASDRGPAMLAAIILAALIGNAAATGGLSKPHHRYQARIAWLLPFAAIAVLLPRRVEKT
ncbi:hypothetical protein ACQW02_19490 [Humitalea sp. 24SJ18S-53]|uniref:hypothetical protein n=1 Tax=Humitalea sp. 24SJ18S-53 TaxID=3422307 RepID=UPI003D667DC8